MSYATHLQMHFSGERFEADRLQNNPASDGDVLEVRYDLERAATEVSRDAIARGPGALWRYAPLLPVANPAEAVTLGEGFTPMLPAPALGADLGCRDLWVKDEGTNPTGVFKDRGASVSVSRLRELGVKTVIHNSSGNAAATWALYCARAGMSCVNIIPDDMLAASLRQCEMAGAHNVVFDGPWHESGALVKAAVEARGWFNCGTLREPYRLEGKKTMGYEIAEQLGWSLPDVVVYPTGGALGAIAIFKAFRELVELGWVDGSRVPRLVVVQYEGCSPIVRAWRAGEARAAPWTDLDVLPGGLKSASPPGDRAVLTILRETGGTAVTVSAGAALDSAARLTRREGIFPCPESATVLAGLEQALADGAVERGERIVLMCTGTGLKSIPVFAPAPPAPRVSTVAELPAV